ncbi:MAG: putative glycoside hydrolase [Holosporales bacterium]|nr:putative glycoside hydrolase [Holosporales bacterium]
MIKYRFILIISAVLTSCCVPKDGQANRKPVSEPIRGIYVGSAHNAYSVIATAKKVSANAVVINVKNELGQVICNDKTKAMVRLLKQHGIYPIARIVSFMDPSTLD